MIENFGTNVKRLREKHHITQEDLAIAIEVQKQAISNIERSKSYPSFENLERIANFFNVSPVELFGTEREISVNSTTAILNRIDEYDTKATKLSALLRQMKDFSPRQLEDLSGQLREIMNYFEPYTPLDEDGIPETDKNDRKIIKQSKYRDLPVKEINVLYEKVKTLEKFN